MEKKLVPNANDTIFKAMYRGLDDNNENTELNLEIKKDFLEFYKKYCNTNSKLQPVDIRPFNLLERKVFADYHNDLAYLTSDDRLIILFEHQSTYNANMPSRLFIYYSMLLNKYLEEKNISLKGSIKYRLPVPELYVIEVFSSDKRTTATNYGTYSIYVDPMFDGNELMNRELVRFDATIIHFDTEEIYKQYLDGKKPEDLIHEFSLYYAASSHELNKLVSQDSNYTSLLKERLRFTTLLKECKQESEEANYKKQKKDIDNQIMKLRKYYKNIAVKNVIKEFQKEKIFMKVLKRMGEDSMVNAMVAVEDEEDRECLLAQVTLDFIKEREYRKKAEEQAQRITAQAQKLTAEKQRIAVQAQKLTAENEEFKNILIKTFGTFDLNEIKKMQKSSSNHADSAKSVNAFNNPHQQ